MIEKSARIYSNDSQSNIEFLTIKANIKPSIQIVPPTVRFQGVEGAVITQTADVMSLDEKPLNIKPGNFNLKEKITYRIEALQDGKAYRIFFTNLPGLIGSFSGSLQLTTNYSDLPEIIISVSGYFQKNADTNEKKQ